MYIEFGEKRPELIPLVEGKKEDNRRFINEAAHAFEKQYEISRMVAERIYDALLQDETELRIPFNGKFKHHIFNGIDVKVPDYSLTISGGEIVIPPETLNKGGKYPQLTIYPRRAIIGMDREAVLKELENIVVHELTHAYVTYNHQASKLKKDGLMANYGQYEKYVDIIRNAGPTEQESILYRFSYAMYSTYYQEMQAFVSQTYSEVLKIMDDMYGTYEVSNDQFRRAIMRTNTYLTYAYNARTAKTILDNEEVRRRLISELQKAKLNMSEKEVISKAKKILIKSISTLNNAYNNAYQYVFTSFKK